MIYKWWILCNFFPDYGELVLRAYSSCGMDRSKTLIVIGVILVLVGLAQPWLWLYATVTVDTTPPSIGNLRVPINQGTYGDLAKVTLHVKDDVSGISTVTFKDDHTGKTWGLELR